MGAVDRRESEGLEPQRYLRLIADAGQRQDARAVVEAGREFLRWHPDHHQVPAVLWAVAAAQSSSDRPELAQKTLTRLVEQYPDHPRAGDARTVLRIAPEPELDDDEGDERAAPEAVLDESSFRAPEVSDEGPLVLDRSNVPPPPQPSPMQLAASSMSMQAAASHSMSRSRDEMSWTGLPKISTVARRSGFRRPPVTRVVAAALVTTAVVYIGWTLLPLGAEARLGLTAVVATVAWQVSLVIGRT